MTTEVCINCSTPVPAESRFCSKCGTPVPGQDVPTLTPQGREIFDRLVRATEGHYEIVRELGRGGMAVVFLGSQKSLDREVAIKVLLPLLGYDPDLVQRFMREARTQGRLEHPYIISVYEVYNQGGLTYFCMPYIPGRNLRSFLQEQPRPPMEIVRRYLIQAAEALHYAHGRGVIHRDVKPDNILISQERNCVVLTDFGIAKAVSAATTLTTPGDLLGTPLYMSPEQGEGRQNLDGRADQYSLGLIGYEMLVGQPAYKANNLAELMYKHRFEEPTSLDELRPDAPSELRLALMRAIRKVPQERFEDMKALIAALEGRDQQTIRVEPGPPADESRGLESEPTLRIPTPERMKSGPKAGEVVPPGSTDPTLATPSPHGRKAAEPKPLRSRWGVFAGLGAVATAAVVVAWLTLGPGLPDSRDEGVALRSDSPTSLEEGASGDASEDSPAESDVEGTLTVGEGEGADAAAAGAAIGAATSDVDGAASGSDDPGSGAGEIEEADPVTTDGAVAGAETESERARALEARRQMEDARRAALEAGASQLVAERLAALDDRRAAAERDFEAGRLAAAATAFSVLADEYGSLEIDSRSVAQLRDASEVARQLAEDGRIAALAVGADERAPEELGRLDEEHRAALQLLTSGDYGGASSAFQDLEERYRQLATRLEEEDVEATGPAEGAPTPREAVSQLIERFRQAFEREDLASMAADVYRGPIPSEDQRLMKGAIFDRAEELRADLEIGDIRVEGNGQRARADISLRLEFRQQRTGERGNTRLDLQMSFASGPDGWRLEGIRR